MLAMPRRRWAAGALVLVCAAVGCAEGPAGGARGELLRALDEYVSASRAVDAARIASFYTATGVILEPGIPPTRTPDSIRALMSAFPGVVVESASVTPDTIEMHGDSTAYVWGSYFERLAFPGQPRSEQVGRLVMHWRREADGAWRIQRYYRIPVSTIVPR
jgi:uncharacterized protein (TIGR02246 family)